MNATGQNILNGIVAIVIATGLWNLQPPINTDVHGIFLPTTEQTYAAIDPTQVKLYTTAPENYTLIGMVNTYKHFYGLDMSSNKQNFSASIDYAKRLAATKGANGLLIDNDGTIGTVGDPLNGFIVYARAIRVNE